MATAPTVSELFAKGEKKRLQILINKSTLAILAFALPVALFLILGGKWIIPMVFGGDFSLAYMPLVILSLGQVAYASMGLVEVILNMTGLERLTAKGVAIAAIASVTFNFILIPLFGAVGAAAASSISLVLWNILLFVWLYRQTGISGTILWPIV